jgi:hypothetical protein
MLPLESLGEAALPLRLRTSLRRSEQRKDRRQPHENKRQRYISQRAAE